MVKEYIIIQMVQNMSENEKMIIHMEKEKKHEQMALEYPIFFIIKK